MTSTAGDASSSGSNDQGWFGRLLSFNYGSATVPALGLSPPPAQAITITHPLTANSQSASSSSRPPTISPLGSPGVGMGQRGVPVVVGDLARASTKLTSPVLAACQDMRESSRDGSVLRPGSAETSPFLQPRSQSAGNPPPFVLTGLASSAQSSRHSSPLLQPSAEPFERRPRCESGSSLNLPALMSNEDCELAVEGNSVRLRVPDGRRITLFQGGRDATRQVHMLQQIFSAARQVAPQSFPQSLGEASSEWPPSPASRTCVVCMEDVSRAEGVECGASLNHFVCDTCLDGYVKAQCQAGVKPLSCDGALLCPGHEGDGRRCKAVYDSQALAKHASPEAFDSYWKYRSRIAEERIAAEMEEALRARAEAEARRGEATRHRLQIAELMTLKCPRCSQAFGDFQDCFALRCARHGCGCGFCGWCLRDCGIDAHKHIGNECPVAKAFNPVNPLWGTAQQCDAAHRSRRQRVLQEYLSKISGPLLEEVAEVIRPDLEAWGLVRQKPSTSASSTAAASSSTAGPVATRFAPQLRVPAPGVKAAAVAGPQTAVAVSPGIATAGVARLPSHQAVVVQTQPLGAAGAARPKAVLAGAPALRAVQGDALLNSRGVHGGGVLAGAPAVGGAAFVGVGGAAPPPVAGRTAVLARQPSFGGARYRVNSAGADRERTVLAGVPGAAVQQRGPLSPVVNHRGNRGAPLSPFSPQQNGGRLTLGAASGYHTTGGSTTL